MYFHTDVGFTFLFQNAVVKSNSGLVGLFVLVLAIALTNQCIGAYHSYSAFLIRMKTRKEKLIAYGATALRRRKILRHVVSTVTYMIQMSLTYILMLAVSVFHPGIMFTAAVGIGIGYYLTEPLILQGMDVAYMKQQGDEQRQWRNEWKEDTGEQRLISSRISSL